MFSRRIASPSGDNRLSRLLAQLREEKRPVLNLAESNPTKVGFSSVKILDAFANPINQDYKPDPHGLLTARSAIALRYNGSIEAGDLFLNASTSEGYGWLFKLLADPGQTVFVPKPGYPLFDYLAGLEGLIARPYRLEYAHPRGWRIDMDGLEAALLRERPSALVLIHPNNPTGSYVVDDERTRLVELCAQSGTALIVDEVFRSYAVEGKALRSFVGEKAVLTFVLDGFSKMLGLPQVKLGWIAVSGPPAEKVEALARLEIIADTYLSAGTPVMNAVPVLLPRADVFIASLVERIRINLETAREILEGKASPLRVLRCDGGWTAVVEVPAFLPEEELALALLSEKGVYVHPGYFFDFEQGAHLALSLIVPTSDFARGCALIAEYFKDFS